MNYVLVAKFKHEEDANEYCRERGNGCFVTDLVDGSYGVYEPLNSEKSIYSYKK